MSEDYNKDFSVKFDRDGMVISPKPDFVDAKIANAPVVPTVNPLQNGYMSQESPEPESVPEEAIEVEATEPEQYIEESSPEPEPEAPKRAKPAPNSPSKELNLRRLREEKERVEHERDLIARELDMMRRVQPQQQYQQQPQQQVEEEEVDLSFGDDDLIEGKQLKKIISTLNNKFKASSQRTAQDIARAQQEAQEVQVRSLLAAKYPDFDSVVTDANLRDLQAAYPEIAATIHSSNSIYNKAVSAYTMIKNLGIQDQEDDYMAQKERVKKNAAKPRPSSTTTPTHKSPLSDAGAFMGELTPAMSAQLLKEMADARRRL